MPRIYRNLSDHMIDGIIDFAEDPRLRGLYWDKEAQGLRIYIGKHKATWQYFFDSTAKGKRRHVFKTLGRFDHGDKVIPAPAKGLYDPTTRRRADWHMTTDAARRKGVKFGPNEKTGDVGAFERYCLYLERKAADARKPPRWARNVRQLGNKYLLPQWSNWTLEQMASDDGPGAVADWLAGIPSAVNANHCARILSAVHNWHRKRNTKLPATNPAQAHMRRKQRGEQKGMTRLQFPEWFAAWDKIDNPVRKAFHLAELLTGARPGELARLKYGDIDTENNVLVIATKTKDEHEVPLTAEITAAIDMAGPRGAANALVFPGCNNISGGKNRNEIPWRGHALRRTYKTFAVDECGVADDISAYLLGHVPEGVSAHYLLRWARAQGTAINEAQQKISKAVMAALRGQVKGRRKRAA
jgi:integrase